MKIEQLGSGAPRPKLYNDRVEYIVLKVSMTHAKIRMFFENGFIKDSWVGICEVSRKSLKGFGQYDVNTPEMVFI